MICPNCGQELAAVSLGPDTPPWLCATCSRGWWQAEIEAAASWEPAQRDFGTDTADVLASVAVEREDTD